MDSCITIHSLYPNLIDADHDAIIESIEKEIQHFFTNEIVRNRYSNIVIVERKGLNLFHPYLHNVAGLHGLSSIKLHGDPGEFPQVAITKNYSLTRSTKNYVIITDAIDTGSEIKRIIYSYYPRLFHKPKISKVCGYLAKKDAITELEKEFPKIEFPLNSHRPARRCSMFTRRPAARLSMMTTSCSSASLSPNCLS